MRARIAASVVMSNSTQNSDRNPTTISASWISAAIAPTENFHSKRKAM